MRCFILAGGYATRLWPLTEKRSKPLLPLAGKPLLTHLIDHLPTSMPVTVSTNEVFEEAFDHWVQQTNRQNLTLEIEDTRHEDHKLGALGALGTWIEKHNINDDVLVLTGDNYLGFDMPHFLTTFDGATPLLAAHDIGDITKASAFGTVLIENEPVAGGEKRIHKVAGFEEKPVHPKTSLVSTGCFILPKNALLRTVAFAKQKPDNVGAVFEDLLQAGMIVRAFIFTDPWLDIGSFHSYLAAHRLLVGENILKGAETFIDAGTECNGSIAIGVRTSINRSTLTDCMVFDDCTIEDCVLRDCIIDDGCTLKGVDLTGKMLRAGTVLTRT